MAKPTAVFVPGLRDHVAGHWQTLLQARLPGSVCVPRLGKDNLWNQTRTGKMTTVQQIEQLVRISREFGREVANGKEAREILKIGVFYDTVDETLAANGFAPNRRRSPASALQRVA